MKSFLLLILSLMAGCEASPEVKGCEEGWAELTCKYPKSNRKYQNIKVDNPRRINIQSTKKDVWEEKDRFSLYHDTKNKNLRMVIKQLEEKDFGKYKCEFDQDSSSEESKEKELKLKTVKAGCPTPFTQTAYETAKTTIRCDYPKKYNPSVTFFCKDNKFTCEEILSTQSSVKSNGTFTLTDTNSGLNMSISNLSSQHAGVYWCGRKSNEGSYRASLRKIQLEIENITIFKRSPTIGQNFTYWCNYTQGAPIKKFICKGEDPSVCQPLWSTSKPRTNTEKFSMEDDKEKRNITITVRNITANDTGTYWCGAENTDNRRSNPFFHKLEMTVGCEASPEVKGCKEGWAELTCKYPNTNKEYQNIKVDNPSRINIQSTKKDVWEEEDRFSLYHDTINKNLRMVIKQLEEKDSGKYKCEFDQDSSSEESKEKELKLKTVKDGCQIPFTQTAYETAKTTIRCDYPNENNPSVKFFCKDNKLTCEEILSTQSSVKSNGTFTLTDTNRGFNMAISNLSSQHAGVYWCGGKSNEGSYRASLRKIQLEIENITIFKRSPTIGQNFTYWCDYTQGASIKKFICKGEDPSVCQPLWSTSKPRTNTEKFSLKDDKEKRNITITVRNITANDTGTYWCGAENTDNRRSNPFFHKLEMTVVPPTLSPAEKKGLLKAIIAVICVAVLMLVLILVLAFKRCACSKHKTNEEGQNIEKDFVYEDIDEHPHKPNLGTALKTIYATANLATNPTAFTHYSNVNRPNGSREVNGDTYSTVKDNGQYSTVNHPSRLSENPLYSNHKPQEH